MASVHPSTLRTTYKLHRRSDVVSLRSVAYRSFSCCFCATLISLLAGGSLAVQPRHGPHAEGSAPRQEGAGGEVQAAQAETAPGQAGIRPTARKQQHSNNNRRSASGRVGRVGRPLLEPHAWCPARTRIPLLIPPPLPVTEMAMRAHSGTGSYLTAGS